MNKVTNLELLYNCAAASSPSDVLPTSHKVRNCALRLYSSEDILERSRTWIEFNRLNKRGNGRVKAHRPPLAPSGDRVDKLSAPLAHVHTVDTWTVSECHLAEAAYAHVWAVAAELQALGEEEDGRLAAESSARAKSAPVRASPASALKKSLPPHIDWMNKVAQKTSAAILDGFLQHQQRRAQREPKGKVISTLFISPRYASYNAERHKKFSVCVNAPLSRLSRGKMWCVPFQ